MRELVDVCKKSAVDEMERFLRNFSFVPDDKLDWVPTPTAKSPLRVAAHTALTAGRFARMLEDRALPKKEGISEWIERNIAQEIAITDRVEMEKTFRQGTDEVLLALDSLSDEEIQMTLDSGMGWTMPMVKLMELPGWHATLHTGQIDYLQTCWGDQQIYV